MKALHLLLAFVCAVFFTITTVTSHIVSSELPVLSTTLSKYALEDKGFIIIAGFYSIGLTQLLLAFHFFTNHKSRQSKSAAVYILLAGIGVILVAIFPVQLPPATLIERLPHITGAVMQFLFFPLAAYNFLHDMPQSRFQRYTKKTALITAVFFIILLTLFLLPSMKDFAYFGLIEKIDILVINFWLIIMSFKTYKSTLGAP